MFLKRNRGVKSGRLRWILLLPVFYLLFTVGYYFLPWTVRRPVYQRLPLIHQSLMQTGYRIVNGWDSLGLFGRDCRVTLENRQGGTHAYGGWPAQSFPLFDRVKLLENESYIVGYGEEMRNPLWVAYRVFDVPNLHSDARPSRFRIDQRTEARVSHNDYRGSGYDRGHMAPNYAIATRYGTLGQHETFLMSNVIPQASMVNRHIWKELELLVARRYGRYFDEVWVLTGPVFREPVRRLSSEVAIPTAYYKIIADETGEELRVMAFLIESRGAPYTRISTRLVSVDHLEALTGLDFFPELPKDVQSELESRPAGRLWPWLLPAVRYAL